MFRCPDITGRTVATPLCGRPNGKGLTDRAGNGQTHAYQRSVKARRDETTKIIEIQSIASKQKKSKAAKVWRVHTLGSGTERSPECSREQRLVPFVGFGVSVPNQRAAVSALAQVCVNRRIVRGAIPILSAGLESAV